MTDQENWVRWESQMIVCESTVWAGEKQPDPEAVNVLSVAPVPMPCPCGSPDCTGRAFAIVLSMVDAEGQTTSTFISGPKIQWMAQAFLQAERDGYLMTGQVKPDVAPHNMN